MPAMFVSLLCSVALAITVNGDRGQSISVEVGRTHLNKLASGNLGQVKDEIVKAKDEIGLVGLHKLHNSTGKPYIIFYSHDVPEDEMKSEAERIDQYIEGAQKKKQSEEKLIAATAAVNAAMQTLQQKKEAGWSSTWCKAEGLLGTKYHPWWSHGLALVNSNEIAHEDQAQGMFYCGYVVIQHSAAKKYKNVRCRKNRRGNYVAKVSETYDAAVMANWYCDYADGREPLGHRELRHSNRTN